MPRYSDSSYLSRSKKIGLITFLLLLSVPVKAQEKSECAPIPTPEHTGLMVLEHGRIVYDAHCSDILDISECGYMLIDDKRPGFTDRTLEIVPAAAGLLRRNWVVDGIARPFDAEARLFLSETMIRNAQNEKKAFSKPKCVDSPRLD